MIYLRILLMKTIILLLIITICPATLSGQEIQMKTLSLNDMSQFREQAGNWQIVGGVTMDRTKDIHKKEEAPQKKKRKKKQKNDEQASTGPVQFTAGKGVLLNMNDDIIKDHLFTTWEHGDIDLEMEVMLPKGSNSGIYLQGRYEVQLLDSWGKQNPSFGDIGGIYRNWESDPGKSYMGKAPITNAARAPGLWQKLYISFRAPRFNDEGEKVANAAFLKVTLNGVVIHDHVEVPTYTGGPIEKNEKAMGPLMIQGDHGPVAFKNIRYLAFGATPVQTNNITFDYYEGKFDKIQDFLDGKPVATGTGNRISWDYAAKEDLFGLVLSGNLEIPRDDTYHFEIRCNGGARLEIGNQMVVDHDFTNRINQSGTGSKQLGAGSHPFKLYYFKNVNWLSPALGLSVESAGLRSQPLHAMASMLGGGNAVNPIMVNVGGKPRLLRAFLDFKGDKRRRLTHTVGIGHPSGIHYVYNLKAGNVVCGWRGNFVDATPMWHSRGDGSFRPQGDVQYFFTDQPLAYLDDMNARFPAEYKESEFRPKGYELEKSSGRPVFRYLYRDIEVNDKITPDNSGNMLNRSVKLSRTASNLYFKIAEGEDVVLMPDGSYAIDDKKYYVKVATALSPVIREIEGRKELIVPMDTEELAYEIIW